MPVTLPPANDNRRDRAVDITWVVVIGAMWLCTPLTALAVAAGMLR